MKEKIAQIRQKQGIAIPLLCEINAVLDPMEKEIESLFIKEWNQVFPNIPLYFLVCLRTGCHTIDWEPKIHIYDINKVVFTNKGIWVQQNQSRQYYSFNTAHVVCPVDFDKLQNFMSFIEEKTGVPVELVQEKMQDASTIERLKTAEDLQCKYGPFTILEQGEVWYKGWEIEDQFVIGKYPEGQIEVWYSTNGHGFGFDIYVEIGQINELDEFYHYLELNAVQIKTTKDQIIQSWA